MSMPVQTHPETTVHEIPRSARETSAPWQVVVHDDPVNYMHYVVLVFQRVFGYSRERATRLMREVHELGESVVWTGVRERAEHYVRQLQGFQLRATLRKGEAGS